MHKKLTVVIVGSDIHSYLLALALSSMKKFKAEAGDREIQVHLFDGMQDPAEQEVPDALLEVDHHALKALRAYGFNTNAGSDLRWRTVIEHGVCVKRKLIVSAKSSESLKESSYARKRRQMDKPDRIMRATVLKRELRELLEDRNIQFHSIPPRIYKTHCIHKLNSMGQSFVAQESYYVMYVDDGGSECSIDADWVCIGAFKTANNLFCSYSPPQSSSSTPKFYVRMTLLDRRLTTSESVLHFDRRLGSHAMTKVVTDARSKTIDVTLEIPERLAMSHVREVLDAYIKRFLKIHYPGAVTAFTSECTRFEGLDLTSPLIKHNLVFFGNAVTKSSPLAGSSLNEFIQNDLPLLFDLIMLKMKNKEFKKKFERKKKKDLKAQATLHCHCWRAKVERIFSILQQ